MAKRSLTDQLDEAVEVIVGNRGTPLPPVDRRLAELLQIAAALRDLPTDEFKIRLKADLVRSSASSAKPALTAFHTATPYLIVRDAARAIQFYKQAFGAEELGEPMTGPGGKIMHAEIKIGDSPIMLSDEFPEYGNRGPQSLGGSSVIIALHVPDVDSLANQAVAAGAKVLIPVADQFYGDRAGRLADPFGHIWIVSTHKEDVPPDELRRRVEAFTHPQAEKKADVTAESGAIKPVREGLRAITPYLQVTGAAKFLDFLKQGLGGQEIFRTARPDGTIAHAEVRIGDSMIELADATPQFDAMPTAIHVYVEDADAVYQRSLRAGGTSMGEPTDQPYGDREAAVKDAFGNQWYIATHKGEGTRVVQYVPEGLHTVMPYLHPRGAPNLIDFLKQAFDAEEAFRHESPDGTVVHAKIRIGDSVLEMGEAHGPYQPMPAAIHLHVADADTTYARALRAGATSLFAPADQDYGERTAGVKDPHGNVWYIATYKQEASS